MNPYIPTSNPFISSDNPFIPKGNLLGPPLPPPQLISPSEKLPITSELFRFLKPIQAPTMASDLMQKACQEGIFNISISKELHEEMVRCLTIGISQVHEERNQLIEIQARCIKKVHEANDRFSKGAMKVLDKVESGDVTEADIQTLEFIGKLTRDLATRFLEEATQVTTLIKNRNTLGETGSLILCLFNARVKELEVFEKQFQILKQADDHALKQQILARNQTLKEEGELFKKLMECAKFSSAEDCRRFEQGLKQQAQNHKITLEIRALSFEEQKARAEMDFNWRKMEDEHALNLMQEENRHQTQQKRMAIDQKNALRQIQAQERGQTMNMIGNAALGAGVAAAHFCVIS